MNRGCRAGLGLVLALIGCGRERSDPAPARGDAAAVADPWQPGADGPAEVAGGACERLTFPRHLPIAEASGAAVIEVDGRAVVLVVGDSGNRGAYLLIDAVTGEVVEQGRLPLGHAAGDDVEGLAAVDGLIWGVTSAGWMRAWQRHHHGFKLVDGPYPAGDEDVVCGAHEVNCGKNYEALCVAGASAADATGCVGFLGSKTDGRLWCLVRDGARLVADPTRSIPVTGGQVLADCSIAPDGGTLWAGTNGFDGGTVFTVRGWRDPATATVTPVGPLGDGFPEAIAVGPDGIVYRFSDTSSAPSLADRYRCR